VKLFPTGALDDDEARAHALDPFEQTFETSCECGRPECTIVLSVDGHGYLLARRRNGFLVASRHVDPVNWRVIWKQRGTSVVLPRRAAAAGS
jgi:hypothetical protein